jgi:hypothetical protein
LLPSSAKAARHGHGPALKELTDGGRIQFPELPAKTTFSGTRSDRTGARKFTPQEISNALIASQGNLSDAARQLGCARDTVYRAIKCQIASNSDPFSRPILTPLKSCRSGLIDVVHRRCPRTPPRVSLRWRRRPWEVPVDPDG